MEYAYRHFVEELDIFFDGAEVWEYTKRMVRAHCEDERLAWLDFDETLSGENPRLSLQGLVLNLLDGQDDHHLRSLHRSLTVGRARARGLSRSEALGMHLDALEDMGFEEEPREGTRVRGSHLRVVDGGR